MSNDFTKKELKVLLHCVYIVSNHAHAEAQDLMDKLQSLIDNYCECDHSNLDTNICYKCGAGVNHE